MTQEKRTIERRRDAVAAGRPTPAYLVQHGDHWHELSWAEANERVESYANGLLSLGVGKGDAFSILATSRVDGALFDRARLDRCDRRADLCEQLREGRLLHRRSLGRSASSARTRLSARSSTRCKADPAPQHVLTFDDLDDLAARGRAYAAERPEALREAREAIEEDDLFTYIYTPGDQAAQGLHDLAPQLLRDGGGRRRPPSFTGPEDTMLLYPSPRADADTSPAPHRCAIAFLPRPAAGGGGAAVRPTVFPSVPRVYEKIHTAVVARFDEATGVRRSSWTGRSASASA